jgi:outer membrane immunogenic protein
MSRMSISFKSLVLISFAFLFSFAFASETPHWAGFYAGVNAGYALGESKVSTTAFDSNGYLGTDIVAVTQAGQGKVNLNRFTGGVQGGYNWELNDTWLTGLELDFNSLALDNTRTTTREYLTSPGDSFTLNQTVQTNWLVTARPRFALTMGSFLFYVTGGLAVTQLKNNNNFSDSTLYQAYESASASGTKVGWTAGVGSEFLFSTKWSTKVEYLYVSFPNVSSSGVLTNTVGSGPNPFDHTANLHLNIIRVGLNYHF